MADNNAMYNDFIQNINNARVITNNLSGDLITKSHQLIIEYGINDQLARQNTSYLAIINHLRNSLTVFNNFNEDILLLNQTIIDTRMNDNINPEDILAHLERNPIENARSIRRITDIQRETTDMENQFPLLFPNNQQ